MAKENEAVQEEVKEIKPKRKAKVRDTRIKLLEEELADVRAKRQRYADYLNKLEVIGRRELKAFEHMKQQTFTREQTILAKIAEIKKEED